MNKDQLDILFEIIEDLFSEDTRIIAEYLNNVGERSEQVISEELDTKLPHIRKELYKLNDISITKFRKTRDEETNWHTIYWRLTDNWEVNLINLIKNKLEDIRKDLLYQKSNSFFKCINEQDYIIYETAMMQNFSCVNCGEPLLTYDNQEELDKIIENINKLERFLK